MAVNQKRRTGIFQRPWISLRKFIQYLALLVFFALFLATRQDGWKGDLVNLPIRLDPLAMLAHLLASRTFLAGSALALLTVLLTLVFGRAWCGWLCPLGTVLDLFPLKRWRSALGVYDIKKDKGPAEGWRRVKFILLITILTAALFANLSLLIFDPLTILIRSLSTSFWPGVDRVFTAAETFLYQAPFLEEPLTLVDSWVRPLLLPSQPAFYRDAVLFGAVFFGVIALNVFAPRFWCRYLCPLGGMLGLVSKAAIFKRRVGEECKACVLCTRACPTGTINPEKGFASDPSECTMCLECLEDCPRGGITFKPGLSLAALNPEYDPHRGQFLASMGLAIAGVALFRSEAFARRDSNYLIRPPGGRENVILEKCTRCGVCVRSCPTNGLQPSMNEAGLESLWTPVLIPRLGYCDYSCNTCGQVCPVQAIPRLSLEEKRVQVIGKAYIDQNRCIAWANHQPCIVCQEMCPLPEKAIRLDVAEVKDMEGQAVTLQLPVVIRNRCIGCGICEYKCPLNGEAAIRIYTPAGMESY